MVAKSGSTELNENASTKVDYLSCLKRLGVLIISCSLLFLNQLPQNGILILCVENITLFTRPYAIRITSVV